MKQRPDQRVGPASWYWPTRYKLLVAAVITVVVIVVFILVNPSPGSSAPVGPAQAVAQKVERLRVPPFNMFKLTGVTCRLSSDRRRARCVGTETFPGKNVPGIPMPWRPPRRMAARFIVRTTGVVVPDCADAPNIFCAD